MLFSSLTFLLYFLPLVILLHYVLPKRLQNPFLLLASLIFYAWGDARQVPLFVVLMLTNWGVGVWLSKLESPRARRAVLTLGLVCDFGALGFYKYISFVAGIFGLELATDIALPLGISFFTFQAAGYLVDVYRRQTPPEKNFITFGAFLFLFPQLIAGPIIRYSDMADALHQKRRPSAWALESGMVLFVAGLASKVLLANPIGEAFEGLRAVGPEALCAWISLIAFLMQVYFDFMGYSVMAMGLGRMMGFEFTRNFNYPFVSRSVAEFWRRWHITLGGWFRDYVYFPLGGSRKGKLRTYVNMFIVWGLTGLWHGADWNFLLWGLWYFMLLTLENMTARLRAGWPGWVKYLLTMVGLTLSWPLFICEGLVGLGDYYRALFTFQLSSEGLFWLKEYALILLAGALFCAPAVVEPLKALCRRHTWLRFAAVLGVLLLCMASLVKSSYNPFLYFRF